jgi:hypothetical protein
VLTKEEQLHQFWVVAMEVLLYQVLQVKQQQGVEPKEHYSWEHHTIIYN